jgi:ribosomal protein S18 acetylase RimI-like enzyme
MFGIVGRMTYRQATIEDSPLLAEFNRQLLEDEGHRNRMTVPELERRMREWLAGEYVGAIFEDGGEVVAYALFRERIGEIYLRQLFVVRDRRRQGIGRLVVQILRSDVWSKDKRLTVEVLATNQDARAFWRAVGYADYSVTLESLPQQSSPVLRPLASSEADSGYAVYLDCVDVAGFLPAFYERLGFAKVVERDIAYSSGNRFPMVLMRKESNCV